MTAMSDGVPRTARAAEIGAEDYRATAWCGAAPIAAVPLGRRWQPWWWTAVAWAGTGHYARSRAALERGARLARADPAGRALLASTAGSIERQLGRHDRGATHDGRALAALGPVRPGEPVAVVGARADALTGLAADLLGRADTAGAERLLRRVDALLAAAAEVGAVESADLLDIGPVVGGDGLWRARLRRHWVGAETAMVAGRGGDARAHAAAARVLAEAGPSPRHRIKTALIGGAAAAAAGDIEEAAAAARHVSDASRAHGLWPLRWAATLLLQAVAPDPQVEADRIACERHLARIGGRFRLLGEVGR